MFTCGRCRRGYKVSWRGCWCVIPLSEPMHLSYYSTRSWGVQTNLRVWSHWWGVLDIVLAEELKEQTGRDTLNVEEYRDIGVLILLNLLHFTPIYEFNATLYRNIKVTKMNYPCIIFWYCALKHFHSSSIAFWEFSNSEYLSITLNN